MSETKHPDPWPWWRPFVVAWPSIALGVVVAVVLALQ